MRNKLHIYLPVLLSVVLIAGIWLGSNINFSGSTKENTVFSLPFQRLNKLNEVINYIEEEYVDSVKKEELINEAIHSILQKLDPHSYYISAKELQAMNEPLEGKFEGIGIQFSIQKDTVVVISPIAGGPSERVGIEAGDRIVKVNGDNIAGEGITNQDVMELLRGEKGTKVDVNIYRRNVEKLLDFTIVRDKIPIHSLDVAFMLNDSIGYLKISRFSKTTHEEFVRAAHDLKREGMKRLVLDLRGNGGGYMETAVRLADEFLEKGNMIVYTNGKARKKRVYHATENGDFEKEQLVVLIDEGSASASEIVAGAIQDNDRGVVIGRRSFGKGLVQEQTSWPDGSAIRLTIARYYTPTGRSIQKPYDNGVKKYYEVYYERMQSGELQSRDSIQFPDSLKYKTSAGKIVYGGGGIMPDVFIPLDTAGGSYYLSELSYKGIIRQFGFDYADKERSALNAKYTSAKAFNQNFFTDHELLNRLLDYAAKQGVEKDEKGLTASEAIIKNRLKAHIGRNIWNEEAYYPVILQQDKVVLKAIELLSSEIDPSLAVMNEKKEG